MAWWNKPKVKREDPIVERRLRLTDHVVVLQDWEMKGFLAWFHENYPAYQKSNWTVCWGDWRGKYDLKTNTISWDYSVEGMAIAEHQGRMQKEGGCRIAELSERLFPSSRGGAMTDCKVVGKCEGVHMVPAIVLPEPKPYYGIAWKDWMAMTDDGREDAKDTYFESVDALRSIYADILKPVVK